MAKITKDKAKEQPKKISGKRLGIIITASILAIAAVVGFVIGLINVANRDRLLDYMNDNLSKYVSIKEEDYKGYPVDILLLREPTREDLDREINKLLTANKSETPKFDGAAIHLNNASYTIGDVVNVWYSGYIVEDGVRKNLPNMSNYGDSKPYALELGSGTFIADFEKNLIGAHPTSTDLEKIKEGKTQEGDIIYLTYQAFLADGSYISKKNERIDLSADNKEWLDKNYGKGFADYLLDKEIGKELDNSVVFRKDGDQADTAYYDVTVSFVTRCEDNAFRLHARFPENYSEPSLRGETVVFDVFAYNAVIYDTPVWNDAFISETLKLTAEELSDYEGASLTEKYEAKLMAELTEKNKEANKNLIEEKMWEQLLAKASFKKLPENEVASVYNEYFLEIRTQYQYYSQSYATIDAFAASYLGISAEDDWREHITKKAEDVVKEKLVFYYIFQEENLRPSDEEFKRLYDEVVEEYFEMHLEYYTEELEECKTEEEREKKLAEIRKDMMNYYGKAYFEENTYYQYALDILISYADIK